MPEIEVKGRKLLLDEDGFLQDWEEWDEDVAKALAADDRWTGAKVELTDEHWEIIRFLRSYYEKYGVAPPIRILVKEVKKAFGPEKGNLKYLYKLFPQGPAKDACRIAGLPKPTGCV
ncbi:Dissimilatory sulfite reductase (desulfoviridin), gamma subunit [Archaeoglobus sulfaticallidus PM70-1]|uniref:Dissimilatory sulfite reductase (Desulfoviridin), gamma subunit n=1 Tax=Archaeoglobus sulfaticallidus PM70-1 TaxID=387631 RepID=N0BF08_9EURY|nr:TusE/DsrC/DsvC family sulfur relay protein [Archaeoglobus sulfaticallidus]AGK62244.1 Dissimilatory sulfite reductase (desulfoviridin), gamma subunit [Archaeoglobus sulfaticallidus PM70-1]